MSLKSINWTWFIIGIIAGVFVIPFFQAKLSRGVTKNKA